jgi:2Fe-2S ferredoxin
MPRRNACPQAKFPYSLGKIWEMIMAKVTFVGSDGSETVCEGNDGMTLMEVAIKNSVNGIDADCGGACACATCHIYVREDWQAATGERTEMESDMLDFAFEVKDNSRLSCQIKMSDALDGLTVDVPEKQF